MKKLLTAAAGLVAIASGFLLTAPAPEANAVPGQCGRVIIGGNGGGFCDGPPAPDGTWMHCEEVYVLGFGGMNCFRVRPVPVEVDPRGWVPA